MQVMVGGLEGVEGFIGAGGWQGPNKRQTFQVWQHAGRPFRSAERPDGSISGWGYIWDTVFFKVFCV